MNKTFNLDHSHIAALTDGDLRDLVGKLCQVGLRAAGLPESAVTFFGDQRANDGGVDVRVPLPEVAPPEGWIPRAQTVFQCKQEKNGRTETGIAKEMKPRGIIRPFFADLTKTGGAYVIVSGQDNCSDSALKNRQQWMRDALADLPGADKLHLDFYDGARLANWVNRYPGVALWVRERIQLPLSGWAPFKDWSAYPRPLEEPYLSDGEARVIDGAQSNARQLNLIGGINRMRAELSAAGKAVRLVGLSGMGKTRLAQALFDDGIGENPLDSRLAVYTDVGDGPTPKPRDMLTRLAHDAVDAVVIVDNCPPDMHAGLVKTLGEIKTLGESKTAIRLLTIEYDVADDGGQETTAAFRLEPASPEVIRRLIGKHNRHISHLNTSRIVEAADGNARLALALAAGLDRGDNIAKLSNAALFDRLFRQRNGVDPDLLRAAEIAAQVYSFDGETLDGSGAELPLLAELADQPPLSFYRHIAELRRRKLVQSRGAWRAVMPQALALHLAARGLENLPPDHLRQAMEEKATPRLLRSFTHRLGLLHDSPHAQRIVSAWLTPGGMLSDGEALFHSKDKDGRLMFEDVAPVRQDLALNVIEAAANQHGDAAFFGKDGFYDQDTIRLLRSLAHDVEHFDQAAWLLARYCAAIARDAADHSGDALEIFRLQLSGTTAPMAQRFALIDHLLAGNSAALQRVGVSALYHALQSQHFSSSHLFDFGARKRDYGWEPSEDDVMDWYRAALSRVTLLANGQNPHRARAREIFAARLSDLWSCEALRPAVTAAARAVNEAGCWPEGWAAVASEIRLHGEKIPDTARAALEKLEEALRPVTLADHIRQRLILWSGDIGDPSEEGRAASDAETIELGRQLAGDIPARNMLLPELVVCKTDGARLLGEGLAKGADNLDPLWRQLTAALAAAPAEGRDFSILIGFLTAAQARDAAWTAAALDAALDDPLLRPRFPGLQAAVALGEAGIGRLHRLLAMDNVPVADFWILANKREIGAVAAPALTGLLRAVAEKPGGHPVAASLLVTAFHSLETHPDADRRQELIIYGRDLLAAYPISDALNTDDSADVEQLVKVCLFGPDGENAARALCRNIAAQNCAWKIVNDLHPILCALTVCQTGAVLDELTSDSAAWLKAPSSHHLSPLLSAPPDQLWAWAAVAPEERFPRLATAFGLFPNHGDGYSDDGKDSKHFSLAVAILDRAPEKAPLLAAYAETWGIRSWSGSGAHTFDRRRALLAPLLDHPDAEIRTWAGGISERMTQAAAQARQQEQERDRKEERFDH